MRLSRGEERRRLSRTGTAEALGIKRGRSVQSEWPSFGLLAHQIAAFSFFFFSSSPNRLTASAQPGVYVTQLECTEA